MTIVPAERDPSACCEQVARHSSARASRAVQEALRRRPPDVVHVEGFYLAQHLPRHVEAPVLLVDQNIEAALWEQRAAWATDPHERAAAADEARRCQAAELAAWARADLCAFVTDDDAVLARSLAPGLRSVVIPDGVDHLLRSSDPVEPVPALSGPSLVFVGNFAYEPNLDAARFLLDQVLPRVRAELPDARLLLVGNGPPPWLRDQAAAVGATVTGWVPSVRPYLMAADVVVCPLRIGGGVKVKVLEALSLGCAIVTTPVGAQGLPRGPQAPLVVEPEPEAFASAAADVLRCPEQRVALRSAARDTARALPTWDEAAARLHAAYVQLSRPSERLAVSA